MSSRTVDISTNSLIAATIIFGGAWFLWSIRDVLSLLALTIILAAALHPTINRLERWGIPRPAGILFLYVVLLGIASIVIITFTPVVVTQLQQLAVTLVHVSNRIVHTASAQSIINEAIDNGFSNVARVISTNALHIIGLVTVGSQWILVGMILVYELVVDRGSFRRAIARLVPNRWRRAFLAEGEVVERRLSLWLRGELTLALFIAVIAGIGLYFLHVKDAFVLALIAGISEFIPLIGPYIGMLPAAAVGFSVSPLVGAGVILLYYLIQQIENNFLAPKVVSQAVGLKPVVVFLAFLIGAHVAGVLGIIVAVPGVILVEALMNVIRKSRPVVPDHA